MGKDYLNIAKKLSSIAEGLKAKEYPQGEIANYLENAGDAYKLAGKSGLAHEFYKSSKNYAHNENIKERIRNKLAGSYPLEKIKANLQKMNISSLEKEVGFGTKSEKNKNKKKLFEPGFWDRTLKPNTPWAILSIASFVFALFFVSANLTGYAISAFNSNDCRWLGFLFFACGLVFTFVFLNNKKKF